MFTLKPKRGFTLIELLVVIAIIGILSSVVLASLNTARLKSRDTRRVADIKQIQLALALYFDAYGGYPANIYTNGNFSPDFIATVPRDPSGTVDCTNGSQASCYKYACIGSGTAGTSYHLGAIMEDTDSPSLDTDIGAAAVGTTCTGTAVVDFHGDAAGCTGTSAADPDPCYDQKP